LGSGPDEADLGCDERARVNGTNRVQGRLACVAVQPAGNIDSENGDARIVQLLDNRVQRRPRLSSGAGAEEGVLHEDEAGEAVDFDRCGLSDSVTINLNDTDKKRAKQIANYPWFAKKKAWQKEIKQMLDNGFKLEVEASISRDISYVTEEYAPARLRGRDWLD
jgi:DNA topoisomerase 6 subunit A-like protein